MRTTTTAPEALIAAVVQQRPGPARPAAAFVTRRPTLPKRALDSGDDPRRRGRISLAPGLDARALRNGPNRPDRKMPGALVSRQRLRSPGRTGCFASRRPRPSCSLHRPRRKRCAGRLRPAATRRKRWPRPRRRVWAVLAIRLTRLAPTPPQADRKRSRLGAAGPSKVEAEAEVAGDEHALHLGGASHRSQEHLRVTPHTRDGGLVHEAVAAMHLGRLAGVGDSDVRGVELRDGGLPLERFPTQHASGCVVVGQPRGVRPYLHVRDLERRRPGLSPIGLPNAVRVRA